MTNAEKYPNTQGALEAWRMYGDRGDDKPFDLWLSLNAVIEPTSTLLEAAKAVIENCYYRHLDQVTVNKTYKRLLDAILCEKKKPIRNCDRYRTAKDAEAAFNAMCRSQGDAVDCCHGCPVRIVRQETDGNDTECQFLWLYAEAEEEK